MRDVISVTTVAEHVFCPKFTYYGHVLGLKQYEEKRGSVKAGKTLHKNMRRRTLIFYLIILKAKNLWHFHSIQKNMIL
jgi:hypothetical protein